MANDASCAEGSAAGCSGNQAAPSAGTIPRRHDLDALRAIAMLLGIFLHGAIAYIPMPEAGWAVHDIHQHEIYGVFLAVIHGFRMPLFFLVSGFFTAMLWRKRGLAALLMHRFKRIFLPLVIGTFTIVPAVWIVSIGAAVVKGQSAKQSTDIWSAARLDDVESIQAHLTAGTDVNRLDPALGTTALSQAVAFGHQQAVATLLAAGADVNVRSRDGTTPLHDAAFLGQAELAKLLIDRGANPSSRDRTGDTAVDKLETSLFRTMVVASLKGIEIDQKKVFSGRKEVAQLLAPTNASLPSRIGADAGLGAVALLLLTLFPLFHHLWFLWFLCWLVAGFALYAFLSSKLNWKMPQWLVVSPLRYAWLIPATLLPQWLMGLLYPDFGPDTSVGLVPMPHILFYYAIFFFFGAVYFDCDDTSGRVGRFWPITLPVALLVVFPIGYDLTMGGWGLTDDWLNSNWYRPAAVVVQVLYVWLMTFGLMGLFRSLLAKENKTMRYISDSSYWLYLAHLPLMIFLQAIMRDWPIPAFAKLTLLCVVTCAVLLASYQWCVRYTPIGTLLNGPRQRPQQQVEAVLVEAAPTQT